MLLPNGLFKAVLVVGAAYLVYGYFGVFFVFGYFLLRWLMDLGSA